MPCLSSFLIDFFYCPSIKKNENLVFYTTVCFLFDFNLDIVKRTNSKKKHLMKSRSHCITIAI